MRVRALNLGVPLRRRSTGTAERKRSQPEGMNVAIPKGRGTLGRVGGRVWSSHQCSEQSKMLPFAYVTGSVCLGYSRNHIVSSKLSSEPNSEKAFKL